MGGPLGRVMVLTTSRKKKKSDGRFIGPVAEILKKIENSRLKYIYKYEICAARKRNKQRVLFLYFSLSISALEKRECLDDVKKKKKKGCKCKIARMDKVIEKRRTTRGGMEAGSWNRWKG